MEFEFDLSDAILKPGKYPMRVESAVLYEKADSDYRAIRANLVVREGTGEGTKVSHFVAIPDPSNKYYTLQIKNLQDFLSACAGRKLDGSIKLKAEEDLDGNASFPDLLDAEFDAYLEQDGEYLRVKRNGFVISDPF